MLQQQGQTRCARARPAVRSKSHQHSTDGDSAAVPQALTRLRRPLRSAPPTDKGAVREGILTSQQSVRSTDQAPSASPPRHAAMRRPQRRDAAAPCALLRGLWALCFAADSSISPALDHSVTRNRSYPCLCPHRLCTLRFGANAGGARSKGCRGKRRPDQAAVAPCCHPASPACSGAERGR